MFRVVNMLFIGFPIKSVDFKEATLSYVYNEWDDKLTVFGLNRTLCRYILGSFYDLKNIILRKEFIHQNLDLLKTF